jgi:hypothetical protein
VCPVGCSELLSSLLKLTEDEEDLALIIPGELAHFFFYYFSAGMRKAVLFFSCYLLLGALSPVLHVEWSRTRPGIIMVSRYFFFLSAFFAVVAIHLSFSSFAPLRLVAIDYCSLFCSLSFAAIPHCFSSLL